MKTIGQAKGKRYLYGAADEAFAKIEIAKPKKCVLSTYKFRSPLPIKEKTVVKEFHKDDVPITFTCTPEPLLSLCVKILDKFPLPQVFEWSIYDICKWLREIGFKQYQNTFRVNFITGRKLLLVDASALSAMNIKDFSHIKIISKGIRDLFYYELTRFGRCLTLYPELHQDVYKLVRIRTGPKYDVRRSDLWRRMQLIRENEAINYTHWEILEKCLGFEAPQKELFARVHKNIPRFTKPDLFKQPVAEKLCSCSCSCLPSCECYANDLDFRQRWLLGCLANRKEDNEFVEEPCSPCAPICDCQWSFKKYNNRAVLNFLKKTVPTKYGCHNSTCILQFRK